MIVGRLILPSPIRIERMSASARPGVPCRGALTGRTLGVLLTPVKHVGRLYSDMVFVWWIS